MDDGVEDRLRRAAPRVVADNPEVSESVRQLVDSVARTASQRARRRDRAGFAVGIAVVAAACAAVVPLLLGQPAGTGGTSAANSPGATIPESSPTPFAAHEAPASAGESDCVVKSDIVPDSESAEAPNGESLDAARAFLSEQGLETVPLENLTASTPYSPESHTSHEVEKQAILDIENALAEAGIYLDGFVVQAKLVCVDAGAP